MKKPNLFYHPNYFDTMDSEVYGEEIIRLEKDIEQDPENSKKSDSYFHLALLYGHYNNPKPNYPRSLNMLQNYLLFYPNGPKKNEALYMQTIVQKIVETDKERKRLSNEAAKLRKNNKKLKDTNAKLDMENQNLQDAIEKLKLLDLMLEEKRLNLK